MSFKSSLEALFKLSSGQAYPTNTAIQVDLSSNSYTATQDGYLIIGANSSNGQDAYVNAWGLIPMSSYGARVCDARIAIPCAKGQKVDFATGGVCDIGTFVPSKGSS